MRLRTIHHQLPRSAAALLYAKCAANLFLAESIINEEENYTDSETFETIGDLNHDYPIFIQSMLKNTKNRESLTLYSKEEYAQKGARLFKLRDVDAGFAIAADGDIIYLAS